jgi:protein-S-isoprenylcysteine O-methyltransferase Ste14
MNFSNIMDQTRGFMADSVLLLRKELQLAKAETSEKIEQAQSGLILILAGMLFLFVALVVLAVAAAEFLATIIPASLATLVVGGVLALVGVVIILVGRSKLKPSNLKPVKTLHAMEGHVDRMREAATTVDPRAENVNTRSGEAA